VIHFRIYNWPHRWPLFGYNINTTREMANFFERHILPEPGIILASEDALSDELFSWGPNPFFHELELKFKPDFEGSWMIYDGAGKLMMSGTDSQRINTDLWQSGIYLVAVQSGSEISTYKLIHQ